MTPDLPAVEIAIVEYTNIFRSQQGRNPVKRNSKLDKAARDYARYLARTGKFSHTADGRQPHERIDKTGYSYCITAENLALSASTYGFKARQLGARAVEQWKHSPGHRKNMMRPHVTEIGAGVAKKQGEHSYYSVQLFARPKSASYKFEILNMAARTVSYALGDQSYNIEPRAAVTFEPCLPMRLNFPKPINASFTTVPGAQFVISSQAGKLTAQSQ